VRGPGGATVSKPVDLGPAGVQGMGNPMGCGSGSTLRSWGLEGPKGQGAQWSEAVTWGLGGLAVLLVDRFLEKVSTI
jgi:hypothetical protein